MAPRLLAVAVAVCGCAGDGISSKPGGDDEVEVGDTAGALEPVDSGFGLEDVPGGGSYDPGALSAGLFTLDRVLTLDLTLTEDAVASINADPYTYVPATLTLDGTTLDEVGVRVEGKLGSKRSLSQKMGFKIDLNRFVEGQTLLGLEKLIAKNLVQDPSFIHEYIAFQVYEAMGVKAPRVGYLWVTVNGAEFGLYANVEAMDDRFLARAYEDGSGNFYDGDYILNDAWTSYSLLDFNYGTQDLFILDEGEDVGHADVHAVTDAVQGAGRTERFMDEAGAVVDLEHHARFMATEYWAGQYDGYSNYTNNYRVYFDPIDGLARFSPWDHDWAFYDSTPMTPSYGAVSVYCYADATCRQLFFEAVTEVCATVAALDLTAEIDRAAELLLPYIQADPRKEVSTETALYYQDHLRGWVTRRSGILAGTYGVSCE